VIHQGRPGDMHRLLTRLMALVILMSITVSCGPSYPKPRWVTTTENELPTSYPVRSGVDDPTLVDGVLFVPSGYSLYALDASNGRVKWRVRSVVAAQSNRPVVDGDRVYMAGEQLFALDAATGAERWTWPFPEKFEGSGDPAVAGGRIYVAEDFSNHIYVLDAATGRLLSRLALGSRPAFDHSMPIVTQGHIYVEAPGDQAVYALDAATGRLLWSGATPGDHTSDAVLADGSVYVAADSSMVYAFDAATGAPRWTARAGAKGEDLQTPIVAGGAIYFSTGDRHLYALSTSTGARLWTATLGDFVTSPATVTGGLVYVGDQDGKLYVLDATTGAVRGVAHPGIVGHAAPVVSDGMVYIGTLDGDVEAFDAQDLHNNLH
jgi:eukaryotic-like serine/threonine-protein kinase